MNKKIFLWISVFTSIILYSASCSALFGKALINGCVKDYWGTPIQNVKVKVKNSKYKSFSDKKGRYSVEYVPGTFTVLYSKEGYSSYEMQLSLSSKEKFEAEDVKLIKLPEKQGVYFYDKKGIVPLISNSIKIAGTLMQSISGLNSLSPNSTFNDQPKIKILLYGSNYPVDSLKINKLVFINKADVQNFMGKTTNEINMWSAADNIPYKVNSFTSELDIANIIELKPRLSNNFYALSWGALHSKDPLSASATSKLVYDFKVVDPKIAEKTIHIWSVGSPHDGNIPKLDVPKELSEIAKSKGYYIEPMSYPAKGFADLFFDAISKNLEPEILVINNWGILDGIETKLGKFTGIRSNMQVADSLILVSESIFSLNLGPYTMLISSSENYVKAKEIATWPPNCTNERNSKFKIDNEASDLAKAAIDAIESYYNCDLERIKQLTDKICLNKGCYFDKADKKEIHVKNINVCDVYNNSKLAFVELKYSIEQNITYKNENAHTIGHETSLVVLRNVDNNWKSLIITNDRTSIFTDSIPRLFKLSDSGTDIAKSINPAVLITEDGIHPRPTDGRRFGDFKWKPSGSKNIVSEIIEFNYGHGSRLFFSFDINQSVGKISTGKLFSPGDVWRWRVLSVASDGTVVSSQSHGFKR